MLLGLTAENIIDSLMNETIIKIDGYRHRGDRAVYMPGLPEDAGRDIVFEGIVTTVDRYRCSIEDGEMIVKLGIKSVSGCPVDYDFLDVYITVHFYGDSNQARADFNDPDGRHLYDDKRSMTIIRSTK